MAHLLGSKNCLECLARDIEDIQGTIDDCIERVDVNTLGIQSWKFPDKLSHELEVVDLLKMYSYSNDPEFDSLAHIVLFELVIDRLVFLVQIVTQFLEGIYLTERVLSANPKVKNRLMGGSMSVGLAVKKFWNKITQVHHTMNRLNIKVKEKASLTPKIGNARKDLQEENGARRDVLLSMSGRSSVLEVRPHSATTIGSSSSMVLPLSKSVIDSNSCHEIDDITLSVGEATMSKCVSNIATQTFDTAFVACEACAHMQQNLVDVGTAMIALCESQGLQSSLAKQKKQLKKSLMAVTDITRWTTEQNRDIERINKHLEFLYSEIEPLKSELEKSRQNNRKLREQVKELKSGKERVEMEVLEKEKELVIKMEMLSEDHHRKEDMFKYELKQLTTGKVNIENRMALVEEENIKKTKQNHHLEKEVARISKEFRTELSEKERLKEIEQEFLIIKDELATVREKLAETEIELGKSQTENKALTKHGKTIQTKQEMLLQRADQLDQECEQLQNRLLEIEDERERLLNEKEILESKNENAEKASADLKVLIDQTSKDKAALENDVKSLKEKLSHLESEITNTTKQLTLLSEFPIAGLKFGEQSAECFEKTIIEKGNISPHDDLAKQVKANNIRIAVLEERNDSLRKALARYEENSSTIPPEIPKDRVILWKTEPLTQIASKEGTQAKSKPSYNTENELWNTANGSEYAKGVPKTIDRKFTTLTSPTPPSQPRTVTSKLNEKRQVYTSGSQNSQGNRMYCAWSDVAIVSKRQTAIAKSIANENGKILNDGCDTNGVFSCPDCNKTYPSHRDLQIHKSFCYAKI